MACGLCIYEWDFDTYRYVVLLSDCIAGCVCDQPPRSYSGHYIYVSCVPTPTTTTTTTTIAPGQTTTSTTSGPTSTSTSTTAGPEVTTTTTTTTTTTSTTPAPKLECMPERILSVYVNPSAYPAEVHIPVAEDQICVFSSAAGVACGPSDLLLSGDLFNAPLYIQSGSLPYVRVGSYYNAYPCYKDFVYAPALFSLGSPNTLTAALNYYCPSNYLLLPSQYDYLAIGADSYSFPIGSYIRDTIDFRFVPLRYIYLAPGTTIRNVIIYYDVDAVPKYHKYTYEVNWYYWYYGGYFAPFMPLTHQFAVLAENNFSYNAVPYYGLGKYSDLVNPVPVCSYDTSTFGLLIQMRSYSIKSWYLNAVIQGPIGYPLDYTTDFSAIILNDYFNYLIRSPKNVSRICPPPQTTSTTPQPGTYQYNYCDLLCQDNTVGPEYINVNYAVKNNLPSSFYVFPRKYVPYELEVDYNGVYVDLLPLCLDGINPPACDIHLPDSLMIRYFAGYTDIPFLVYYPESNYPVTYVARSSSGICNLQLLDGRVIHSQSDLLNWGIYL